MKTKPYKTEEDFCIFQLSFQIKRDRVGRFSNLDLGSLYLQSIDQLFRLKYEKIYFPEEYKNKRFPDNKVGMLFI